MQYACMYMCIILICIELTILQVLFVYKAYNSSFINERVSAYTSDHHDMRLIIIENTIRARNIKRGEKQKNKGKKEKQFSLGLVLILNTNYLTRKEFKYKNVLAWHAVGNSEKSMVFV